MKQEVKPAEGKLGIMVVGCGAVATTFMTGVLMVRKGLSKPVGSMTQYDKIRVGRGAEKKYLHYGDIVPLAKLDDIVFGTWDAYPQNAYQAAVYAEVLKAKDIEPVRDELELKRLAVSRLGKQVIDVVDVDAGYADTDGAPKQVLSDVTWLIGAGDRYGLLGENGAGKSTLLDVIQGKIEPTRGRVKIGQTVRFGVLSQQLEELEPYMGDTIREVLGNYKKYYVIDGKETSPEKLCERLGFTTQQLWSRIGDLSGGQRRRLSLLLTILDEPNVLILDEPGNDLDTDMLAIVEDLLDGWPGTLILVTHDRFLMERVTDQQWALLDGHLTHMPGGVDQYLRLCNATAEGEPVGAPSAKTGTFNTGAAAAAAEKPKSSGQPNGLSNAERQKLRREVSSLERKMETQRTRVEEAEAAMAQVDPTNYTALGEQQAKIDEAHAAMDELEMAWLEASEKLEGEE